MLLRRAGGSAAEGWGDEEEGARDEDEQGRVEEGEEEEEREEGEGSASVQGSEKGRVKGVKRSRGGRGRDNRHLVDDNSAQRLSAEQICSMKR